MTKLIWIMAMFIVVAVSADDIKGVLPEGDDTKIENVQFPKVAEDGKLAHVELTKNEPLVESVDEKVIGQKLMPIFPSFLEPKNFFNPFNKVDDNELKPKRGVLTIILLKRKHPEGHDLNGKTESVVEEAKELEEGFVHSAKEKMHSLTNFILSDVFGQKQEHTMEMQPRKHLLGGDDDPDHFFSIRHGAGYNENSDLNSFIRYIKGDQMPVMGNDLGYADHMNHHQHHKNCNFLRYLKMKAHVHYRTIVHLVFISGIILIILLMINIMIKSYRRRYAHNYYSHDNEQDISSIDSAYSKQKEAEANGSLNTPSIIIAAPPAYDEVNVNTRKTRSSLIKSLAAAYKNRYERVKDDSSKQDEDSASVSSLPPYEAPKSEKK